MYIDKWWGNVTCGDTEDAMVLLDYLQMKNQKQYTLSEIIKDANLEKVWGIKPLYEQSEIDCRFLLESGQHTVHADIDIPINLIIDLSALVLQSIVEKTVVFEDCNLSFSVSAEKKEIEMMIAELTKALQEPHLYYPDFLQDAFAQMQTGIMEICNELNIYTI